MHRRRVLPMIIKSNQSPTRRSARAKAKATATRAKTTAKRAGKFIYQRQKDKEIRCLTAAAIKAKETKGRASWRRKNEVNWRSEIVEK